MHRPLLIALAGSGLVVSASTAFAEIITVCASGCEFTSINAAIDASSNGDVIQLSAETYFEGEQIDTDGKAITLRGVLDKAGEPASVLDGSGTHRVLTCQSGEGSGTVFDHLVIQNGLASGGFPDNTGGGMFNNESSSPTLTDCTFTNNTADNSGGGMYNYINSSPALTDCTFTSNSADYAGSGMYNVDDSSPTLTNCTFTSNSADFGGGMINSSRSSPTLTNCTFTNNTAYFDGGGMYNLSSSSPTLTDCTFTDNSAGDGGGMYNYFNSSPTLTNCTFTDNTAGRGGGMYNESSSSPTLTDCTFTECCQVDPPRSFVDAGGNDYDSWCDECRADVNCKDNEVNSADLGYMLAAWGTTDPQCDLDGDGFVRAADLGLLLGYWGPCD